MNISIPKPPVFKKERDPALSNELELTIYNYDRSQLDYLVEYQNEKDWFDSNDLFLTAANLLKETGPGHNTVTAYDTAWVARLKELLPDVAEEALNWLRENQLPDGSWGMEYPVYYHDRVLCTLSAVIALRKNNDVKDKYRVARGLFILQEHVEMLHHDLAGPTAGFEMLLPSLVEEAREIGLFLPIDDHLLNKYKSARSRKLNMMPDGVVSRHVTMAFSAESAGSDALEILDIENLLEDNGSVALSPSATAYYLLNIRPNDQRAREYIRSVTDGGVPNFAPFDIYEKAWVLWNFLQIDLDGYAEIERLIDPLLESLNLSWIPGKGVGFSTSFSPLDSDDTAVVFEVLARHGYELPIKDLLRFEEDDHFRCFDLETHPSTGANIHMLGALYYAGFTKYDRPVQKILNFLAKSRIGGCMWADKWHISPYYITAHAIIAFARYYIDFGEDSVQWMIESQNSDGSWGYQFPTAEETAYCLQALVAWHRQGYIVPASVITKGYLWLKEHADDPIPPLWTAKCLYSPTLVVKTTIVTALLMVEQAELGVDESALIKYPF